MESKPAKDPSLRVTACGGASRTSTRGNHPPFERYQSGRSVHPTREHACTQNLEPRPTLPCVVRRPGVTAETGPHCLLSRSRATSPPFLRLVASQSSFTTTPNHHLPPLAHLGTLRRHCSCQRCSREIARGNKGVYCLKLYACLAFLATHL